MRGTQRGCKFSVKAGCQSLVFPSKVFYVSAMDMVILAHSSLKVCDHIHKVIGNSPIPYVAIFCVL